MDGRGARGRHGTDYRFRLDGGDPLPDPRTRWQPEGIFGPSRVYEHDRFVWSDGLWTGRTLPGSIIYELHIGTFTPAGTFEAAIEKLDHLAELGVGFVEVMPVPPVPGERNWGYDGVDLWAVTDNYGGPDGLKRFVDACHRRGLGVILDVVYNHLGPSGNFLAPFGPYFHSSASSFWGQAVNLDGPGSDEVRRYFIGNALQWLRDYHIDGLRLDAVHALHDERATHFLEELAVEVDALSAALGRPLTLIAESDLNDPGLMTPREAGGYGLAAAWNDDVHHALHAAVTGERHGYYEDFATASPLSLAKVLTSAYYHDGTYSAFRGRGHGRPARHVPGHRFVVCAQNHDQIGNRAEGDRMDPEALRLAAGLLLTSPFTPMLFMGEEWGAHAVPVLHRPRRACAAGGRGRPAAPGVRGLRLRRLGGEGARPGRGDDVPALQARLERARRPGPPRPSRLVPRPGRAAPYAPGPVGLPAGPGPGGARRRLAGRPPGAFRVTANLGRAPVTLQTEPAEIVLASDPGVHLGPDLVLPPRSLAILRV
nr:hypothetical protein GCM10020093_096470 [Planobispora longispora]